jgi:hypothetical protein
VVHRFIKKNHRIKTKNAFNKFSFIGKLIKLFFIPMHKIIIGGTMNVLNYIVNSDTPAEESENPCSSY